MDAVAVNNVCIEQVHENKFLCIMLDHNVCWKPHFKRVRAKIAKSFAVLAIEGI